jgi:hypothetical protein
MKRLPLLLLLAASLILIVSFAGGQSPQADEGFVSLFDGQTLAGWHGGAGGYDIKENAIVTRPEGKGNLYTDKEYGDFHLKFEFKLTPGANNGIGIRQPEPQEGKRPDPAYAGMEIQVLDDTHEKYAGIIHDYQHHGSIYGVVPAKPGHLKPVGEWNSEEIIAQGKQIKVILNGETIVDADIEKASTPATLDGKAHPGLARDSGHICFCGHGAEVWFRNLRIKELK